MSGTARFILTIGGLLMSLGVTSVGHAHHSHASLDKDKIQQHRGIVTRYSWRMPHVFIQARAPNPAGELVTYTIELLHPPGLVAFGWSKDTFKAGDAITWEGPADRDPNRYYSGLDWAEKADGTRLVVDLSKEKDEQVEPSTDFTGTWVRDTKRTGFTYYPIADWPYTQAGKDLVEKFDALQNPQLDCEDPGPPRSTTLPYPIKITKPDANTFVMDYDMRDQQRVIKLNQALVTGEPSKVGQSTGRMDGDELVFETTNFVPDRWGSYTGMDSSERKHLVERFSLLDGGMTLRVRMTLADPVYLAEPVEIDWYLKKQPDRPLLPGNCTLESARLYIEAGYQ